ncbi:MAG: tetratricopeptide repeat protein [Planctomycetes bacterium]|nr:tetratricopeptide repeat protein [Planctomycetota bacterium]
MNRGNWSKRRAGTLGIGVVLFVFACVAATETIHATCGGGGGGGGGSQQAYTTMWTPIGTAKDEARKAIFGIVYYFPASDSKEHHGIFVTKEMSELSRRSPVVLVTGDHAEELRAEYGVDKKVHTLVVTDWHGNLIKPYPAKGGVKQRIPIAEITAAVRSSESFVAKLEKDVSKNFKAGKKAFEEQNWKNAIKELNAVASRRGFTECEEASAILDEIVALGRKRLEELRIKSASEKEEAIKELRKLAEEFKDSAVEKEASKLVAELKAVPFRFETLPQAHADRAAWSNEFAADLEKDEASSRRAASVEQLVASGAELEAAHDYAGALAAFEKAHALDPQDPVPLRYLGEVHRHHTGEWATARACFDALLALEHADPYSRAIALHGLGKMTIHAGDFAAGLELFEKSLRECPTQLAYRNLAVYWNSEGEIEKARGYVRNAVALDPADPYTRVFEAVYIAHDGDKERALAQVRETRFDPSMYYNIACIHSVLGDKDAAIDALRKHFYEYETNDQVRAKEMIEARSDRNFRWLFEDPEFRAATELAGRARER